MLKNIPENEYGIIIDRQEIAITDLEERICGARDRIQRLMDTRKVCTETSQIAIYERSIMVERQYIADLTFTLERLQNGLAA